MHPVNVIGLMSGTSMDGIDAVLIETDGQYHIKVLNTASLKYELSFRQALKKAELSPFEKSPSRDALIRQSTELHGALIQQLLDESQLTLDLIGYHGQTIYHRPEAKITLQIGEPQFLADKFSVPVVYDFRTQDILHGGQGAPLAPLYHQALMINKKWNNLVIFNCGGIANISIIRGTQHDDISGFDTGPGNVLLDRFVREWTNEKYTMDENGAFATKGTIDKSFLDVLYQKTTQNHYYDKPPPKSLDSRDIFFIDEISERFSKNKIENLYNGCATLAAFTAYTMAKAVPHQCAHCIVAGGGAKNPAILQALSLFLPKYSLIQTAEEAGFSNDYLEAELIAWLAVRSLRNLPLTIPQTTGVKQPQTGGRCVYPN